MEAAILLQPTLLAEAELTGRVMAMGLNVLITEAGRRLGVSELTASLMWPGCPAALRIPGGVSFLRNIIRGWSSFVKGRLVPH